MTDSTPTQRIKLVLSTKGTGLGNFASTNGVFRKDFIRVGNWHVRTGRLSPNGILAVTKERIQKWASNFNLMLSRGVTVPLTVDHIEVQDPVTGKMLARKLTPAMAEAKRGSVVQMCLDGERGDIEVIPSDDDAIVLMNRCPEVSLELERNFKDGEGNIYDEAITAITLTPKPVVPGQEMEWEKVAASRDGDGTNIVYLSAEPIDIDDVDPATKLSRGSHMANSHAADRIRKAMALPGSVSDEDAHNEAAKHLEQCSGRGRTYMSREDFDKELNERLTAATAEIDTLKTQLAAATVEAGKVNLSRIEVDAEALETLQDAYASKIDALVTNGRITPSQKALVMSLVCGTKEAPNKISLSRKVATAAGLTERLGDSILKIFETGDVAEMAELLKKRTGVQEKIKLSHGAAETVKDGDKLFDQEMQDRLEAFRKQNA